MPKYWSYELKEKSCEISFIKIEELDVKLTASKELLEELNNKVKEDKKNMDNSQPGEEKTKNTDTYLKSCAKYNAVKKELAMYEENELIHRRNNGKKLCVERLKDTYSRTEAVSIKILDKNNQEDGKIVSTTSKIKEDVYKLEEYGMYLTAPYCDELAKIIKDIYFDLEPQEREYIENNVSKGVAERFYEICMENIKEHNEKAEEKDKIIIKEGYYCVKVSIFNNWYLNSSFKRYSNTDLREALIIYDYARGNKGRNDVTVAGIGKAICLKV